MARFEVEVNEVRSVRVRYVIEADDATEALALAESGDTIEEHEDHGGAYDVTSRHPDADTLIERDAEVVS